MITVWISKGNGNSMTIVENKNPLSLLGQSAVSPEVAAHFESRTINPNNVTSEEAVYRLQKWLKALEQDGADNTSRAYMSAAKRYAETCHVLGINPLPITTDYLLKVIDYFAYSLKLTYSTLKLTCTVVNVLHEEAGFYRPTMTKQIKLRLKKIRRELRTEPKQAPALRREHLDSILAHNLKEGTPLALRNATIASLSYDALLRRSEVANIKVGDITEYSTTLKPDIEPDAPIPFHDDYRMDEKLEGTLYIPYSKSDQEADGAYVYLSSTSIRLVSLLIEEMSLTSNNDFLLRGINNNGTITDSKLSTQGVYRAMQKMGKIVGINFTGHSGRVGACLDLDQAGYSTSGIQHAGRWATPAMPAYYTRKQSVLESAMARFRRNETRR